MRHLKNIIIVPGWQNSEKGHWQTLWQQNLLPQLWPKAQIARVEQNDWQNPMRSDWVRDLASLVRSQSEAPLLITHSMGTMTAAILSSETDVEVAGAFMVSPVDLNLSTTPQELIHFLPTPVKALRFPSVLVGSESDTYCSLLQAKSFAQNWGCDFKNAGDLGHINVASGCGEWAEGFKWLKYFCRKF